MNDSNKLNDIIKTSLENIRSMLDANTIIGDPITTSAGTTLIPISKISVGYVSGGLDYLKKDTPVQNGKPTFNNFGGGGGTGITVSPVAFIVINADGKTEILNINAPTAPADSISQVIGLIERSPELIDKLKTALKKK